MTSMAHTSTGAATPSPDALRLPRQHPESRLAPAHGPRAGSFVALRAASSRSNVMWFPSWLRSRNPSVTGKCDRRCGGKPGGFRPRLEALEGRDVPSTLTVTNTNDSGPGSLRAEIALAKNNTTIAFDPQLDFQTITLTSGELNITSDVTILGRGAGLLKVSGGGNSRVFEVAPKVKVNISGLTISDGNAILASNVLEGGGIYNRGTLTVSNCNLFANHAIAGGGISNHGTLTVSGCTLSGNIGTQSGGGIFNAGAMTVSGSYFVPSIDPFTGIPLTGNRSYWGGGIFNQGKATATVSSGTTLSGNAATEGDLGSGYGGGMYNAGNAKLTVSNCTLSGDSAGNLGGGIYNAGTLTVSGSAFSSNTPDDIYGPYIDGGGNTFG